MSAKCQDPGENGDKSRSKSKISNPKRLIPSLLLRVIHCHISITSVIDRNRTTAGATDSQMENKTFKQNEMHACNNKFEICPTHIILPDYFLLLKAIQIKKNILPVFPVCTVFIITQKIIHQSLIKYLVQFKQFSQEFSRKLNMKRTLYRRKFNICHKIKVQSRLC